jgi:hypothetical protein
VIFYVTIEMIAAGAQGVALISVVSGIGNAGS